MDLSLSGLASGMDWKTLVDQLAEAERTPQKRLQNEQSLLAQQVNAYSSLKTQLNVLRNRVTTLMDAQLFESRSVSSSDSAFATVTAVPGAVSGSYNVNVSQIAKAAKWNGSSNIGGGLHSSSDVSSLVLSQAAFSSPVTAGTLTVNGKQITVATSDTLQQVFDKIGAATGGTVASFYDSDTDKISLTSSEPVVLGSATDSSNFFQIAKLSNNGTGTITSQSSLGTVNSSATLSSANFSMAVSDGGSGLGEFKINGVSITYNASGDSINNLIDRINKSSAGVIATFDSINDRLVLNNKTTGDVGLALEDVTGNFLEASGLVTGQLERGQDLKYTINGGQTISNRSNTIAAENSGLTGLTMTVLKAGDFSITSNTDTAKIKKAIQDFLADFNKAQSVIDTQTASTTNAKGVVTAGLLSSESDASDISAQLRSTVYSEVSGLSVFKHLADIGIKSSGYDNSLSLDDEDALDAALNDNLDGVQKLFSDSSLGLAVKLDAYLEKTVGDSGTLNARTDRLSKQGSDLDTQIADLEKIVQDNKQRLLESFQNMETAQANMKQQLSYLTKAFGSTTTS